MEERSSLFSIDHSTTNPQLQKRREGTDWLLYTACQVKEQIFAASRKAFQNMQQVQLDLSGQKMHVLYKKIQMVWAHNRQWGISVRSAQYESHKIHEHRSERHRVMSVYPLLQMQELHYTKHASTDPTT